MSLRVVITVGAERDLEQIDDQLMRQAGAAVAAATLDRLERRCGELAELPERGNIPPELAALGINEYRELHERPYRIVYRVLGADVAIYLVADARRDFRSLLEQRLLRGER